MDTRAFGLIRKHKNQEYLDSDSIRDTREETLALSKTSIDTAITLVVVEVTVVSEIQSLV